MASLNPTTPDATPLTYGGVRFSDDSDTPVSSINIGQLKQELVETKLPGGGKITSFMGLQADKVEWNGVILGHAAETTLRTMQAYQADGKERLLEWWIHRYYGTCEEFVPTGRNANRLEYKATIHITRAGNGTLTGTGTLPPSSAYTTLLSSASGYSTALSNADASAAAQSVTLSVDALQKNSGLAATVTAKYQQLLPVLQQVQAYASTVSQLSPAFVPAQQLLANLTGMANSLTDQQIGNTISVQGPASVYDIAAQHFGGNVTKAFDILAANNLFSPRIAAGVTQILKLPV